MASSRWLGVLLSVASVPVAATVFAASLDKEGNITLGVRTYVSARVGTENTDGHVVYARDPSGNVILNTDGYPLIAERSYTFPKSDGGHLRQNRMFAEIELKHRLDSLKDKGFGPLALLRYLPFRVSGLQYDVTYRGEGEGIYDWGPHEYSHGWGPDDFQISNGDNLPVNPVAAGAPGDPVCSTIPTDERCRRQVDVLAARRHLRRLGTERSRLFQAYVESDVGEHLWLRFGRQILAWGETDSFRLLDNINPIDNSFGGFLIPLDERRVPLDMLRGQLRFPGFGPVEEPFFEFYAAIDDHVGYSPGTPEGSPWTLPNLGDPQPLNDRQIREPARTIENTRGGGRLVWNMWDATFSVAHYYTYFDNPRVQMFLNENGGFPLTTRPNGYSSMAVLTPARVQVSGGTATFPIPIEWSRLLYLSGQPIIRTELAYFDGEARYRQSEIDPYVIYRAPGAQPGTRKTHGPRRDGESINFVLGIDLNQFIRPLNAHQSFFISTQFFYKHLIGAADRGKIKQPGNYNVEEGEVLPVPSRFIQATGLNQFLATEPVYVHNPTDQMLHTLLISTSMRSSTINPALLLVYDWAGAFVLQPSVTFLYDPFRFTIDYSFIEASGLHGASGISLLRDRDNLQFRFEYVI